MSKVKPFQVYKSSAGSGKTFTLARVFLGIVISKKDPSYFKHVLGLTFTVKAAAEMKNRILQYLFDIAHPDQAVRKESPVMLELLKDELELNEDMIRHRADQIHTTILYNYGDFALMTIDKFIARLVRSFSAELSLRPDFEILVDQGEFIDKAIQLLYDRVGDQPELTKLVEAFLKMRFDEGQSMRADDLMASAAKVLLAEEYFILKDGLKHITPSQAFELHRDLGEQASSIQNELVSLADSALELIHRSGLEASDLNNGHRGIYGVFVKVQSGDFKPVLTPNNNAEKAISKGNLQSSSKHPGVIEIQEEITAVYQRIMSKESEVKIFNLLEVIKREVFALGFMSVLQGLFDLIRKEENVHLLSEFNQIVSEQLQKEHAYFLFERVGNKYNHLLIDEFQDTSSLQWQVLMPLLESSLSESKTNLIVGDAKQSIYRFRESDPFQFTALPATGTDIDPLLSESFEEHFLEHNHRSATNIVAFNNYFFSGLTDALLEDELGSIYLKHEQQAVSKKPGSVKWHFLPAETPNKLDEILEHMISRTSELITKHGLKPSSICCLFGKNSDASKFAARMLEMGFPVISEESLLIMENPKVRLIHSAFVCLQRQRDPFEIQHFLARYHEVNRLPNYHVLAKRLKSEQLNFPQLLQILELRLPIDSSSEANAFKVVYQIVQVLGVSSQDSFVQKYLDVCLEYEIKHRYLQESFIEYWDRKKEKISIALPESNQALRVMTIHKSKGLEFDTVLVFLPKIKRTNLTKNRTWIDLPEELGSHHINVETSRLKGTPYESLWNEEDQKSTLDGINATYVAFTRAENRLEVFSGHMKKSAPWSFLEESNSWNSNDQTFDISG